MMSSSGARRRLFPASIRIALAGLALTGIVSGEDAGWADASAIVRCREDIAAIFAPGSRRPGSEANLALEERVGERFADSGFEHGQMRFAAPHFLPGRTVLTAVGQEFVVRPLHPALFRPGNFAERRFTTEVVDGGFGRGEDLAALSGQPLRDRLILLDFNSGRNWQRFLRFGVKGFLFIEPEEYGLHEAMDKVPTAETSVPRFFMARESGLALRALMGGEKRLAIDVAAEPSRWENRMLRNLWVLVPGADEALRNEVAVLVAPLDANGVVPELAEGAQAAANLHVLLAQLERCRREPPARSLLLVVVNARAYHYLGDRVLAWYLLQSAPDLEALRHQLAADLRHQEMIAGHLARLQFRPDTRDHDEQFLIALRTLSDDSTGRLVTVKDPLVALCKRDVNEIKGRQLQLLREIREWQVPLNATDGDDGRERSAPEQAQRRIAELAATREELDRDYRRHVNVLTLFNRVGIRTRLGELETAEVDILRGHVTTLLEQAGQSVALNRRDLEISVANARIRAVMAGRTVRMVISLEMVWDRPEIGFAAGTSLGSRPWANRWGRNTIRVAEEIPEVIAGRRPNLLVDTLTNLGGHPEMHYVPCRSEAMLVYQAARRPAFSLNNVFTAYHRAFTPADTFANLDYAMVSRIAGFLDVFLPRLLADARLTLPGELASAPLPKGRWRFWSCLVKACKFDEFAAGVMPEIPVPGSVVLLADTNPDENEHRRGFSGADVVDRHWALTDDRAAALFYGLNHELLATAVFRYDDDFLSVDHVGDAGETHEKINSNLTPAISRVLPVIPCEEEFPVLVGDDPSLVGSAAITVKSFFPLSADRNSAPRKYGMTGARSGFSSKLTPAHEWGPAAFFMPSGEALKLLTRQKRLALGIDEDHPDGRGFRNAAELGTDFHRQAVRDLLLLNRRRQGELRGVSDSLVESFIARGAVARDRAEQAAWHDDHADYLGDLYESLGALTKGHEQVARVTNDMIKSVVFFMALLLPFCLFVQRLLFKSARIEAQMAWFSLLFVGCYVVFRMIHPAFRVAQAPEAMFIAFVMGGLGLFVIYILHGRFEGEMKLLLGRMAGRSQTQAGYSLVGQQAMMIGVSNMRRRRIRTTLTTATIVLVTFTMLAFTSISRQMSPTMIRTAAAAPYTGLMYHWPGGTRMDEPTWQVFDELFTGHERVTRRWLMPPSGRDQAAPFRVETDSGRDALIEGVLGLAAAEDGFLGPMPLVAGRFFTQDAAAEVVLPASLAEYLHLTEADIGGARLRILGRWLTLVGIADDDRLRLAEDLNGLSILPIQRLLQGGDGGELPVAGADGSPEESGVFYVHPSHLLVLPVETARRLGATAYSVSVRLPDDAPVWPTAERLLITTGARFFIGSRQPFVLGAGAERQNQPGVYYLGSGFRTSIGGLAMLIIPLLIAGTIILNTMLGTVFERKQEIAVFNAIGLNPTHIATFFLAEALVYGIIGAVGGYLVGQLLGILLNRHGWIADVNLNFSSLNVAYVIVFTIAVVLLSTIYPAIVATRSAVPSGQRKWTMPAHDGVNMEVVFPFIYQPELAAGVMHYLANYFAGFRESSTGDLIATPAECRRATDDGRAIYDLAYDVALAPFDLGVTEAVRFRAAYSPVVGAYRVTLTITRQSGQDANWVATNQPFLERLRQLLLHWRSLTPAEHDLQVRRGRQLFAEESHVPH